MAGWSSVAIDDVVTIDGGGAEYPDWKPLRHVLGIGAFGVNAWLGAAAGEVVIEDHDEAGDQGQEELYVVVRGRARFTIDGSDVDAPAGTCVAVTDAALRRVAVAEEEGTVVLALGAVRGEAFSPSDWEQRELEKLDG